MQSTATTVDEYLASLPPDRRAALTAVREVILQNLDAGYEESMQYGMIGYGVSRRVHPAGYHCDPSKLVPFAALASQKGYMSLYLMSVYTGSEEERWFREAWARSGKKLDMGKCCIRFKKVEDLALDVIADAVRRVTAHEYVTQYQRVLSEARAGGSRRPAAAAKAKAKGARPGKTTKTARIPAVQQAATRAARKAATKAKKPPAPAKGRR